MATNPNLLVLKDLLQLPGNNECVDCGAPDPDWASYNLGVFICQECAGIHRSLGTHISKVRSITLDKWDDGQVEAMKDMGNLRSNELYVAEAPACYRRPLPSDVQVIREQWIMAKYVRKEFIDVEKQTYLTGTRDGILYKKGRDDGKFLPRRFVLSEAENTLKYYTDKKDPKAVINLDTVNATFAPEKINHANGLQITYDKDGSTRCLYVFSEIAQEIVDWYTSIRCAKLNRLRVAFPSRDDADLVASLNSDFLMEGWLSKTGPQKNHAFKKRWFTLDKRKLMYFDEPLAAFAKGEVFIGYREQGYSVGEKVPSNRSQVGYGFTLTVPDRDFILSAETKEEQLKWIEVLNSVIDTLVSPQDSSLSHFMVRKRGNSALNMLKIK
ncbi:arf-GAP with dual PH domain-containing protein 1-like [Tubulanus polymorphus]|uniref:arf-GAP with dual PH domain-containing protein 1-like n=1 Tax=Tubulanus polymorphus TaxID=672921 RepID=UPI003DA4722B